MTDLSSYLQSGTINADDYECLEWEFMIICLSYKKSSKKNDDVATEKVFPTLGDNLLSSFHPVAESRGIEIEILYSSVSVKFQIQELTYYE